MLANRLIACFDVIGGKVTKASQFQNNIDIEDAVTAAKRIYEMQIDELIFYDVTASAEKRPIDLNLVEAVGKEVFVPYTVGGGIRNLTDMYNVLKSGAEKISVDSMAVRNPEIIAQGAKEFGSQCIVLSMQVKRVPKSGKIPSGYEIAIDGARVFTGMDALEWARRGAGLGAGEIVVNSIDNDGTHHGYDLEITGLIAENVRIPIVASGGAGKPEHHYDVLTQTQSSAGIISSMLYSPRLERNYTVREIKEYLQGRGVEIRPYILRQA
ncbi:MAG: imidazole glycerol phosphate synthase subunit HisF [Thermoguttaceae bacterium]|nr:imidazole glycerol phosphate synthase subunit HisF [Thermoguttaceae bacterium]